MPKIKVKKTITMKMTAKEAQWLKRKMQYATVQGDASRETPENAAMRKSFWNSLQV